MYKNSFALKYLSSTARKLWLIIKAAIKFINRIAFLFAASFMIGFSNAINDENLTINDNKPKIELEEIDPDRDGFKDL